MYRSNVLVCGGTGCTSSNSMQIAEKLKDELVKHGLEKEVNVITTGCFGLCALGPIMVVYPEGSFYSMVKVGDIPEIVEEHLLKGRIVTRLLYQETVEEDTIKSLNKTAFYAKQKRVALRNCGVIDPEKIDDYIARDGYAALGKVLTEMTPEEVIQTILDSGLRGRGGAGFPTGLKWKFAAGNSADQKYVCCNADEGDPGAFMDRSVLEGDPHSLIEAMAIAGYAIGASQGRVYVRAEYPIAVKRLQIAIDQAREYGLLGKDIFGTGFDFDMELRLGAGAFVCGEETALMTSIEGKRGEPRPRPPFPAVKGLYQKPTILKLGTTFLFPIADKNTMSINIDANKLLVPSMPQEYQFKNADGTTDFDAYNAAREEYYNMSPFEGIAKSFYDAPGGFEEELREINFSVGIEYSYNRQFSLRAGYYYEDEYKGNRQFFSFGASFAYSVLQVDAAYLLATAASSPLDQTLRFTLSFDLEGIKNLVR